MAMTRDLGARILDFLYLLIIIIAVSVNSFSVFLVPVKWALKPAPAKLRRICLSASPLLLLSIHTYSRRPPP